MTIHKQLVENKQEVVVKSKEQKFVMGWFAGDLYWIMPDYTINNKFVVKEDDTILWEFFTKLFKENYFKNCTFIWRSEAGNARSGNRLKITQGLNHFKIRFIQGENDVISKSQNTCAVCFCLSGSRKPKIAEAFSNLLHKLINSD